MLKKIRERIAQSRRVVIKVGTNVLAEKDGTLSVDRVKSLVSDICRARDEWNKEIVLVTSGAIGAGMAELKVAERPKAMPELQALASVGQCRLIQAYHDFFRKKGVTIGQVLLTLDDLTNRKRHLNTSNTLMTLLRKGVLPVINENDTVAVDEIRFGDNDILSAMVSILIRADLLIILSTVDGFYDTENNILFEYVCSISEDVKKHIRADKSALGVGGHQGAGRAEDPRSGGDRRHRQWHEKRRSRAHPLRTEGGHCLFLRQSQDGGKKTMARLFPHT
jgi:glutamate 5-kinase